MKLFIFLNILISSTFAFANPCEDTKQLKALWDSKYVKLVQNPEALGSDFDRSSKAFKLAQAICILEYPGVPEDDGLFYRYFTTMIKTLVVDLFNQEVAPNTLASTAEIGVLDLHKEFFIDRPDTPFIRASTLVHEARHVELKINGKPSEHVICSRGRHMGSPFCDAEIIPRLEDASTHAYELIFLTRLYENSVFYSSDFRIREYTNDLLATYFNYVSQPAFERYYKR